MLQRCACKETAAVPRVTDGVTGGRHSLLVAHAVGEADDALPLEEFEAAGVRDATEQLG